MCIYIALDLVYIYIYIYIYREREREREREIFSNIKNIYAVTTNCHNRLCIIAISTTMKQFKE